MRFWDSSAVVPLVSIEPHTALSRRLHRQDGDMVVWSFTRVEVYSALCRKLYRREIDEATFEVGKRKLGALTEHWIEVTDLIRVRGHAERFLRAHPLRAADALQLGAAWHHAGGNPKRRELVVFDGPLLDAAARIGFTVLAPK